MLNDASRNRPYHLAIDATVMDPTFRVIDIGAASKMEDEPSDDSVTVDDEEPPQKKQKEALSAAKKESSSEDEDDSSEESSDDEPTKVEEKKEIWHSRVIQYWKHLKFEIQKDSFRNVMDMSANLGGFAASLKKKNVWVMNVVPFTESGKLKIIYDRGLMGTTHDWCESFSTYPRTYDLLHAWLLFSEIEKQGCSLEDLLIEMDRILRPYGYAIIRDKVDVVTYIKKLLPALRWDDWTFEMRPKKDALTKIYII
uniref:Methyltransferase n=1 Tax=Zea mays TaxID=4577 RepID=A0A804QQ93_MAIZE